MKIASVLLALMMVVPTTAQTLVGEGTPDDFKISGTTIPEAEAFVKAFRSAIADQSCFKVAALSHFQVRVNAGPPGRPRSRYLYNRTALCRYFFRIFTADVRRLVLTRPLRPVGWRGLMFGDGPIWIESVDSKLGFGAANLNEP